MIPKKYSNKITIIALAPLTNIALTLKTYSEIADKIHEIHIMGGNFYGN